ncbi:MAG: hypothetical protein HUK06_01410 [Bacteroidaceae bacterium]|nr:hypothetical protein [Bacteroidaceae bacterium]
MKTTILSLAFAAIAMTANANTHRNSCHITVSSAPIVRVEVRNDIYGYGHRADWRHCNHIHIDHRGKKAFCHSCGMELRWKGHKAKGHYEVITARPVAPCAYTCSPALPVPPHPRHHR